MAFLWWLPPGLLATHVLVYLCPTPALFALRRVSRQFRAASVETCRQYCAALSMPVLLRTHRQFVDAALYMTRHHHAPASRLDRLVVLLQRHHDKDNDNDNNTVGADSELAVVLGPFRAVGPVALRAYTFNLLAAFGDQPTHSRKAVLQRYRRIARKLSVVYEMVDTQLTVTIRPFVAHRRSQQTVADVVTATCAFGGENRLSVLALMTSMAALYGTVGLAALATYVSALPTTDPRVTHHALFMAAATLQLARCRRRPRHDDCAHLVENAFRASVPLRAAFYCGGGSCSVQ